MKRINAEQEHQINAVEAARFVGENLEKLVLQFLHRRQQLSSREAIREIFLQHGVSINPAKMDTLLDSLKNRGLVMEATRGLITVYALTEKGRKTAEQVKEL